MHSGWILGPDEQGRAYVLEGSCVTQTPLDEAEDRGFDRLHCRGLGIGPGHVNSHTRLYRTLARLGAPEPKLAPPGFLSMHEHLWWRLERALDPRAIRAAARFYAAEALLAGTTVIMDHHSSPGCIEGSLDVIADACQEVGIRAVLSYAATERNGGRPEARRGLLESYRFIQDNHRPLVRGVVGLDAAFALSDETLHEAGQLCRQLGTVVHMPVAEDPIDLAEARRAGYEGPLERLHEMGALPEGSLLAQGLHLNEQQVRMATHLGCWLIQNPRSNRRDEGAYPKAFCEGTRIALGTDGFPANMVDEANVLFQQARKAGENPAIVVIRVEAGLRVAAERFGRPFHPVGPAAVGDIVVADEKGRARHVIVDGRLVVKNGKLLTASYEELRAEARAEAQRLLRDLN